MIIIRTSEFRCEGEWCNRLVVHVRHRKELRIMMTFQKNKNQWACCLCVTLFMLVGCGGSDDVEQLFLDDPTVQATPTPTVAVIVSPSPSPSAVPTPTLNPSPSSEPSVSPTPAAVSLSQIQTEIFDPFCSVCHSSDGGGGLQTDLLLDSEINSFNSLVGVQSAQLDTEVLVIAGDADNSYLVKKLEGDPSIEGLQMPRGMPPLSESQIALVRNWINAGALQSENMLSAAKVSRTEVAKTANGAQLKIYLSATLDPSSIGQDSVLIYTNAAGANYLLDTHVYHVSVEGAMVKILISPEVGFDNLDVLFSPLGVSGVLGYNGIPVDADGNGEPGGSYSIAF